MHANSFAQLKREREYMRVRCSRSQPRAYIMHVRIVLRSAKLITHRNCAQLFALECNLPTIPVHRTKKTNDFLVCQGLHLYLPMNAKTKTKKTIMTCQDCACGIVNDDWSSVDYYDSESDERMASIEGTLELLGWLSYAGEVHEALMIRCPICGDDAMASARFESEKQL